MFRNNVFVAKPFAALRTHIHVSAPVTPHGRNPSSNGLVVAGFFSRSMGAFYNVTTQERQWNRTISTAGSSRN